MKKEFPLYQSDPKAGSGERGNTWLHFLDFYLGVPLVFLLGLFNKCFKKQNKIPPNVKKIGLLQTAAIGDTLLMATPIAQLKAKYPEAEIHLFHGSSNQAALPLIATPLMPHLIKIKNPFLAIQMIQSFGPFDLWIDFGPWPRFNALLTYFISATYKIGFSSKNQFRHFVYDQAVEHSDQVHELQNQLNLLNPVVRPGYQSELFNSVSASISQLKIHSKNFTQVKMVVLHMFPGGSRPHQKEWPTENWIKLIEYLQKKNYQIVLSGGAVDKQKAEQVLQYLPDRKNVENLAGALNLEKTAELICRAQAVVSVNTGILHLAALLGANLVGLHGPTSAKRWGPINLNSTAIQSPRPCSPCLHLGSDYKCPYNLCMQEISSESVQSALNQYLESN